MIVNVVGVKHVKGTSKKNGKDFDFYKIMYTRDGRNIGYDGLAAGDFTADHSFFKGCEPKPGDTLMVDRDDSGYIESIDFVIQ